jgi:hypothetical protein
VDSHFSVAAGFLVAALVLTACGSGSSHSTGPTTSTAAARSTPTTGSATTLTTATAAPVTSGASTCPTLSQANTALGVSDQGPIRTPTPGGGVVCEYTGGGGNAGVTIFAHQSPAVFAGQVANAGRAPGMQKISGLDDGAFALTAGGRSVVNAYSNATRTVVAAQAPGALAPTEALARVALADN